MTSRISTESRSFEQAVIRNTFLSSMMPEDFAAIRPYLKSFDLREGISLQIHQQPIEHVYFIESGLVSLEALTASDGFQVAMVGRHGLVGISVLLGESTPAQKAVVIVAGKALRICAEDLKTMIRNRPQLGDSLLSYAYPLLVHSGQNALCSVHHSAKKRLASWLCLACDGLGAADIPMTYMRLSKILGLHEADLLEALNTFEKQELLRQTTSGLTINNSAALKIRACECYAIVAAQYLSKNRLG